MAITRYFSRCGSSRAAASVSATRSRSSAMSSRSVPMLSRVTSSPTRSVISSRSSGSLLSGVYVDDCFDAVCGFNAFFFADDMVAALREAGRVAKPGAPIVIQVWGRPEAFDLHLMKDAIAQFAPPPPAGRLDPTTLWRPGVLEDLATQAGLVPDRAFDLRWAYEYADEAALTRAMMSAGGFGAIVGPDRQVQAKAAIVDALAVCRTPEGGYRLENEWHSLIARAAS